MLEICGWNCNKSIPNTTPAGENLTPHDPAGVRKLSPVRGRVTYDVQRIDAASCSATRRWPSAVMWMPSACRKPLRSAAIT